MGQCIKPGKSGQTADMEELTAALVRMGYERISGRNDRTVFCKRRYSGYFSAYGRKSYKNRILGRRDRYDPVF